MKKTRILSIDGGGIRGILPGTIMTYLETQIKKSTGNENANIGEYFDLVAGTSTGGILSLIYICPDENGAYMFNARQALDIYLELGDEIFDVSLWKKFRSMGGLLDEKYNSIGLEAALLKYFGEKKLSQTLKPCLITSYDIQNRKAHFFTSLDAESSVFDYYLRDVARATSAAPTLFEPVKIQSIYGMPHALIDGGVFANNPALCAYAEARTIDFSKALNDKKKPNKPTAKEMIIISIGTGARQESYHYDDFKNASKLKWSYPLIDISMSGNSETLDYQLKMIYDSLPEKDCRDYYRIQPKLIKGDNALDNAQPDNLKALHEDGLASVEQYKTQLDEIVEKLILNH